MLVSEQNVIDALGRELSEAEKKRFDHVATRLSHLFCQEAGTDFTVHTYTHRLKVDGGQVRFHHHPVVSVDLVVDDSRRPLSYRQQGTTLFVDKRSHEFVTVTYTAGYEKIPDIVISQISDSIVRILQADPVAASGVKQRSTTAGPYSESFTYANYAVGGQVMLSPDDIRLARSLRPPKTGHCWVNRP